MDMDKPMFNAVGSKGRGKSGTPNSISVERHNQL